MICSHCRIFFARWGCVGNRGECDCPKCQGLCTCRAQGGPNNQAGLTDMVTEENPKEL